MTNKYQITVTALGYEDHSAIITASSKSAAQVHTKHVVTEWIEKNDIDEDSRELAFVKVSLVK